MSDTPRTDEACRAEHDGRPSHYVVADFARRLERENQKLREVADGLASFAIGGHYTICESEYGKPCSCGCDAAFAAYQSLSQGGKNV
jgi:hypothetical protein